MVFPIRINRYLALKGYATRRQADELIEKKCVKINDRLAIVGDIVQEKDVVSVTINRAQKKQYSYFLYFKPRGIITHSPQGEEKEIADILKLKQRVFPVGRLDKDSRGLIVLTDDGRIVERLLSPSRFHEKEYQVKVNKPLTAHFIKNLAQGVQIEDYRTKPAKVTQIGPQEFRIVLTEGKKHQIRRMASSFGYTTSDIFRTRIMNLVIGKLKAGDFREITGLELENFLKSLGLK
ncbi:MAG: pseudouridine synthase [bacterium]|nr:pseudouridine synthase [bacterium]